MLVQNREIINLNQTETSSGGKPADRELTPPPRQIDIHRPVSAKALLYLWLPSNAQPADAFALIIIFDT